MVVSCTTEQYLDIALSTGHIALVVGYSCSYSLMIPYFRVIRRISLISAYLLMGAYYFVGLNARC